MGEATSARELRIRLEHGEANPGDAVTALATAAIEAPTRTERLEACRLLGQPIPPLQSLEEAGLSPAARAFYAENRRVANGKAKRILKWQPRYRTYREGLRACLRENGTHPTSPPQESK